MSKAYIEYCGQQVCREAIVSLQAQRDALLAAAKKARLYILAQPQAPFPANMEHGGYTLTMDILNEAIAEAENP
jgi:hypothetical protein